MNAKRMTSEGSDGPVDQDAAADCGWRLSCLLDGELDAEHCREILEQYRRDAAICRRWALLNCVGDALRSPEVAAWHSDGFVARVSAALEKEPTVLAPAARPPRGNLRRWILPGAGAAAAAAVLVVVGLPSRQSAAPDTLAGTAKAVPQVAVVMPEPQQIDRSPLLESYLAAHRELAEPTLMPQSTPYVRTSGTLHAQEQR
jgi:sigma-E factor negative regulatory protein RseA